MRFVETALPGAYVIELDQLTDDRGWFARTYERAPFEEMGLVAPNVECSASFNARAGTLRGLHYQAPPHAEDKLVRCVRGAIFDAIVDLRPDTPTYCQSFAVELTPHDGRQLLVPKGCAHGFQTLLDETEVTYQMSYPFVPGAGRGVRWDDPAFGIQWPATERRIMSERDATYPDFEP
jgi:dTDP-4-dehydrorhamnose 3,5-epimerase